MAWFKDWFNTSYYHLLYGERDEKEAGLFIRELIHLLKPEPGAVFLDLACGRGRHSLDIASHGYPVYGIDLSGQNIAKAKLKSSESLHFDVHDMRMTYKKDYFDIVLNLFTSFGYFEEIEDNLRVLQAVHSDLKKNGVFVQDYFNANMVIRHLLPLETKTISGVEFTIRKTIRDNCVLKDISFRDKGCDYKFQERVRLFSPEVFKDMYNKIGFEIISIFGDYRLNAFNPDHSERLILISKKRS